MKKREIPRHIFNPYLMMKQKFVISYSLVMRDFCSHGYTAFLFALILYGMVYQIAIQV